MLESRLNNLLSIIIEEYTKKAEPVGSHLIVDKLKYDISSATIRNEMAKLEEMGYIYQPHTSAGRVPTEKGYQYYIENFLVEKELNKKEQQTLRQSVKKSHDRVIQELAKCLADQSGLGVIIGFGPRDVYYTGLSNLFNQPEFYDYHFLFNMSIVIDHLDEVINEIFDNIQDGPEIMIGAKNPFNRSAGSIVAKYKSKKYDEGLVGILGPIRMNYQHNLALIKYCQNLISNL